MSVDFTITDAGGASAWRLPPGPHAPEICAVLEFWRSRHAAGRRFPSRRDIDPIALGRMAPSAFPFIWLLDVERQPLRFRYRLIGDALRQAGAVAQVGRYVDEYADPTDPGGLHQALVRLCQSGEPSYRTGAPQLPHDRHVATIERLSLPLASDGAVIDMILCISVYLWREPVLG